MSLPQPTDNISNSKEEPPLQTDASVHKETSKISEDALATSESKLQSEPQESQKTPTKSSGTTNSLKLEAGGHSDRGGRRKNEDAHSIILSLSEDPSTSFFAVFDGHGGKNASAYCQLKMHKNIMKSEHYKTDLVAAMREGILKTDEKFLEKMEDDGSTANMVMIRENHVYCANVGDSRCVMSKDGKVRPLSIDHKPQQDTEKARIEASGHEVSKETIVVNGKRDYYYRIDGIIAVSRSIGDAAFKDNYGEGPEKQAVSAVPDFIEETMSPGDFLILACDGLWDVMSNEDAVDYVARERELEGNTLDNIANKMCTRAMELGSQDNITIIVVSAA
eukprot:TRINITY_DN14843_c0_g1_i1.p1 TRINITY_DN14843_c0_g1~~TRINITY_DN14843_c0_g1_i1.p1  ORF type:complete len:334 (-),score=68.15 TRINITY_DN14843_c0_g1_i1:42-1043(-)